MGFNWEGALGGVGEGLQTSASYLTDKYDKDFKERQAAVLFKRQEHLTELAHKRSLEREEVSNKHALERDDINYTNTLAADILRSDYNKDLATHKSGLRVGETEGALSMVQDARDKELSDLAEGLKLGHITQEQYDAARNVKLYGIKPTKDSEDSYNIDYKPEMLKAANDHFKENAAYMSATPEEQVDIYTAYLVENNPSVSADRARLQAAQQVKLSTARNTRYESQSPKNKKVFAEELKSGTGRAPEVFAGLNKKNQDEVLKLVNSIPDKDPTVEDTNYITPVSKDAPVIEAVSTGSIREEALKMVREDMRAEGKDFDKLLEHQKKALLNETERMLKKVNNPGERGSLQRSLYNLSK